MKKVNNEFYDDLADQWHTASDHPIALLRAENRLRNPWIASFFPLPAKILDMGCGAGFLTHELVKLGHGVTGIDLSERSLQTAQKFDQTGRVAYLKADATALPFPDTSFDAVCAMDLLEHVENPSALIQEASRVLKPGGLFFFHTFNRTPLSWLMVIKGVEWCVKNTPRDMHIYRLFLKPSELEKMCSDCQLKVQQFRGVHVQMGLAFWKMMLTRKVPNDLQFKFGSSLKTGYSGVAIKERKITV